MHTTAAGRLRSLQYCSIHSHSRACSSACAVHTASFIDARPHQLSSDILTCFAQAPASAVLIVPEKKSGFKRLRTNGPKV